MGIDAHAVHLLRHATRKYGPLGRTVTLGRQSLHLGPRAMKRWTGLDAASGSVYCESMLKEHFGASVVDSIDNSPYEGATHVADMNRPLPQSLGAYDRVLDFGCTEHIFDIGTALRNAIGLCKPGGVLMHIVPANGFCGHGFYQFSPEMFYSLYERRNGFEGTEVYVADLLDTRHWYAVSPPSGGRRVNIRSASETYVIAMTRRVAEAAIEIQQSDYVHAWSGEGEAHQISPRVPPRRSARIRESLARIPGMARLLHSLDSALSPNVPKRLGRNADLRKLRTESLG